MPDEPEKIDLNTPDLAADNLAALEELFPGVAADGVVDAIRLAELVGLEAAGVKEGRERYGLMWAGKNDAVQSLVRPIRGTLKPRLEESVDFSNAANVFIEGDNLEVLKLLQKAYNDEVKLIYIDPPYNTGEDLIYDDDFKDGLRRYLEYTGELSAEGTRIRAGADLAGRAHSRWLSMMYPRLVLARNLLQEDGLILLHIDEHEFPRLVLMMDEIFGPENSLGEIVWDKRNPKGDAGGISAQHEYVVAYARSKETLLAGDGLKRVKNAASEIIAMADRIWATVGTQQLPADLADALSRYGIEPKQLAGSEIEVTPDVARKQFAAWLTSQPFTGGELAYKWIDDDGDVWRPVSMAWPSPRKPAPEEYFTPLVHPTTGKECPVPEKGWRNPPEKMKALLDDDLIVFGADETTQPQRKYLLRENMTTNVSSIIPYGGSDADLLKEMKIPFDNPKPLEVVGALVAACTQSGDLIVDFFAGSGTCAHAVALQNAADGAERRCLSVNIPEPIKEGSVAARAGYLTISEITLARILGAMDRVEGARDLGLRCFALAPSNFQSAPPSSPGQPLELLSKTLADPQADDNALAAEIFINEGIRLDSPWEITIAGESVAVISGAVAAVLAREVTAAVIDESLALGSKVLVFLEDGFAGRDALRADAFYACQQAGITMKTV
jgi:adenine-specific DNA-methyltransferase